jgi:hypothetical protein
MGSGAGSRSQHVWSQPRLALTGWTRSSGLFARIGMRLARRHAQDRVPGGMTDLEGACRAAEMTPRPARTCYLCRASPHEVFLLPVAIVAGQVFKASSCQFNSSGADELHVTGPLRRAAQLTTVEHPQIWLMSIFSALDACSRVR